MIHNTKLALAIMVFLFGSRSAFAAFELNNDSYAEQALVVLNNSLSHEGDDEDQDGDSSDKDKINVDDTLVYDDLITGDDTLVYEDFDTPKKGGEDKGRNFKRTLKSDTIWHVFICGGRVSIHSNCIVLVDNDYIELLPTDVKEEAEKRETVIQTLEPSVNLYPNPSRPGSTLYLELDGFASGRIRVMDLSGRLISTTEINGNRPTISGLSSGTFLVTVSNESAIKTVRVIVQ